MAKPVSTYVQKEDDEYDWAEIEGYPNYKITSGGIIINCVTGRVLKPFIKEDGYHCVKLTWNSVRTHYRVSRLVATAFVGNPHRYPIVDHIDGDKSNNNAQNLVWTTYTGNNLNSRKRRRKNQLPRGVSKDGNQYRVRHTVKGRIYEIGRFETVEEASAAYEKRVQTIYDNISNGDSENTSMCSNSSVVVTPEGEFAMMVAASEVPTFTPIEKVLKSVLAPKRKDQENVD